MENLVRVKLEKVAKLFIACAILHNFGKIMNDEYEIADEGIHADDEEILEIEVEEDPDRMIKIREQKRTEVMGILMELID